MGQKENRSLHACHRAQMGSRGHRTQNWKLSISSKLLKGKQEFTGKDSVWEVEEHSRQRQWRLEGCVWLGGEGVRGGFGGDISGRT